VVAHDPRIIPFADRIIHIEDGRIVGMEPGGAGSKTEIARQS
jgi:putative ABC transport system ATP-binding protein